MLDAFKYFCAVLWNDLKDPNRDPECDNAGLPSEASPKERLSSEALAKEDGHRTLSDCREAACATSEQNPQVPLASEDAFAQVPGNAETASGNMGGAGAPPYHLPSNFIRRCKSWGAHDGETRIFVDGKWSWLPHYFVPLLEDAVFTDGMCDECSAGGSATGQACICEKEVNV